MKIKVIFGREPWSSGYGGDSRLRGCGFESKHWKLNGHFSHYIVVKNVNFVHKRSKKNKKEARFLFFRKGY